MKTHFTKMLLIFGLLLGVGHVNASAQVLTEGAIQADIPFSFVVRNTTLPAGKYTLRRVDETETHVLEIRSANGRIASIFEAQYAETGQIPNEATLVFDRFGDQYFLSQIWSSETKAGYQLPKTKAEERLESNGMHAEHRSILAKAFGKTKKAK